MTKDDVRFRAGAECLSLVAKTARTESQEVFLLGGARFTRQTEGLSFVGDGRSVFCGLRGEIWCEVVMEDEVTICVVAPR